MKNFIILLTLTFYSFVHSQNNTDKNRNHQFGLSVVQDAKLATMRDDAGNVPFTTDATIKWEWRAYSKPTGYFSLILLFEYADLKGGDYMSYGLLGGYTFDEWLYLPTFGLLNHDIDIDITPYGGLSIIHRKWEDLNQGYHPFNPSVEFGLDITLKVHHNVGVMFDFKLVDRQDLKWMYDDFDELVSFNFGIGIKYEFTVKENKARNNKLRYRGFYR